MDKRLSRFMGYSFLLLAVIGTMAALFFAVSRFFTIDIYNRILSILIILSIVIMVAVIGAMAAIYIAVRKERIHRAMLVPVRLGMKLVMPFALFVTGLFKQDKDMIRGLFVDINNIFVQSGGIRKSPEKIMLLLPHCLQNSECIRKVTGDLSNCAMCGRCTLGKIRELVEETGVHAYVVTGGTAARNTITRDKPEMVLSVACERDLAIGISDVSSIPILGVLNRRPNGPCINTTVDVELLREKLYSILESSKDQAKGCETTG